MSDRDLAINRARIHLAEASRRRHSHANRDFYWVLIAWAQRCRRMAAAMYREPTQGGLFE